MIFYGIVIKLWLNQFTIGVTISSSYISKPTCSKKNQRYILFKTVKNTYVQNKENTYVFKYCCFFVKLTVLKE